MGGSSGRVRCGWMEPKVPSAWSGALSRRLDVWVPHVTWRLDPVHIMWVPVLYMAWSWWICTKYIACIRDI